MQGVSRGFNTTTGYFINCKSLSLLPESPPSSSCIFYSIWGTWIQWVLLITQIQIFWCPKPEFKFRSAESFTVGRFAKQIYFNLSTGSLADQSWVQNNIVISALGQIGICFQYILICMKYIHKYISATWWCYHSQTHETRNVSLFLDAPASLAPTPVSSLVRNMSAMRWQLLMRGWVKKCSSEDCISKGESGKLANIALKPLVIRY